MDKDSFLRTPVNTVRIYAFDRTETLVLGGEVTIPSTKNVYFALCTWGYMIVFLSIM